MAGMLDQDVDSLARETPGACYAPLVPVAAAAAVGILCDRLADLPPAAWLAVAAFSLTLWVLIGRVRCHRVASLALLTAVAACAGGWHQLRWNYFDSDDLGLLARDDPQPVCLEALAIDSPRHIPAPPADPLRILPPSGLVYLDVRVLAVRDGTAWRRASGRARLVISGQLLGVLHGDRLRIFASLSRIALPENPGQFDRQWHERSYRRVARLRAPWPDCVTVLRRGNWFSPRRWLNHLRIQADRQLGRYIGPHEAALASAVLLGAREQIDPDLNETFFTTGAVHLLAISGLHVGMVAVVFYWTFRHLGVSQQRAMAMVAALVMLYALLAQARPPVVRAAILVFVWCIARFAGRAVLPKNSLAAALLIVLAMNPADLFRTGVQLSFLAAGVIFAATAVWPRRRRDDPLDRLVERTSPVWRRLAMGACARCWQSLLLSGVLWLVLLPLIVARFHAVAWIAPLVSLLAWIPMAAAVISGLLLLLTGWLLPPAAMVFGWLCRVALRILQQGLDWAQQIPGNPLWVVGPPDWWLAGFYGMLGLYVLVPQLRPRRLLSVVALSAWLVVLCAVWPRPYRDGRLRCTFLSVGHGCAVVIETPSGRALLFDAGCFGDPQWAASDLARYLRLRGHARLDRIVLSHPDVDHYNMVPYLLDRFAVDAIVAGPLMFHRTTPAIDALRQAIARAGTPLHYCTAGDTIWSEPGCALSVLHPPAHWRGESDNANSLVVMVDTPKRRVLLTGDIEPPGLDLLLRRNDGRCDVLLVPHHGSRRSTPPGLLAWCRPRMAIVSGAAGDLSGEVMSVYRSAGIEVFHTARSGAIEVLIDGVTMSARPIR